MQFAKVSLAVMALIANTSALKLRQAAPGDAVAHLREAAWETETALYDSAWETASAMHEFADALQSATHGAGPPAGECNMTYWADEGYQVGYQRDLDGQAVYDDIMQAGTVEDMKASFCSHFGDHEECKTEGACRPPYAAADAGDMSGDDSDDDEHKGGDHQDEIREIVD